MDNLLDTNDLPEIIRKEDPEGNITYVLQCGETYDQRGTLLKTKIEKCIVKDNNNTNKSTKLNKELKKHKQKTLKTSIMAKNNSDWAEGVYEFTDKILDKLISDGLIVEGNSKEDIMKKLFEGYEPGEKVPKMKKAKAKTQRSNNITGYQFFTKSNKEEFHPEFNSWKKTAETPRFMKFMGEKWASLSEEEKVEWNKKAREENEAKAAAKASEEEKEEE